MDSFLLIGQSNMAGRGSLKEAPAIDTSHIYTLRNGRWQRMFRPINPDRHFSGTNLAESFAELLRQTKAAAPHVFCYQNQRAKALPTGSQGRGGRA